MFYRWRRMQEEDRGRVWRLYGWFTALMACGSCIGAVSWAAQMLLLINFFQAEKNNKLAQSSLFYAASYTWHPVFVVTYAIEFLCLSVAKLMVLDRMSVFAALQSAGLQTRWAAAGRVVMAAVVLGNAVGLAANAAAAVHYQKAAQAAGRAYAYYAANNTKDGDRFLYVSREVAQLGGSIASVQSFCEVAVLLLIVVAFVVVGVVSARRMSARLLGVDAASAAAATGRAVRQQMLGTTAFVFATFLLRSVLSTMYAVAAFQSQDGSNCSATATDNHCAACHNVYAHMYVWMVFTPEFESTIELISSPLALLVALWGMTSKHMLQLMKSREQGEELAVALMRPKKYPQPASS
jgi:hypothetical protein